MVYKKSSGSGDDEFDAWGIGQKFTVVKFLNPLKEFSFASRQAKYGVVEGQSEFNDPIYYVQNRLTGLDRMHFILLSLTYDVYPFLDKYEKKRMLAIRNRLDVAEDLVKLTRVIQHDHINHIDRADINEVIFSKCISNLLDISSNVIEVMNQTGFIFRLKEEFDPDSFIDDVVHGG